jgi:hypothetical protein
LDTTLLLPDESTFCLVWRGSIGVTTEDASDVAGVRLDYTQLNTDAVLA